MAMIFISTSIILTPIIGISDNVDFSEKIQYYHVQGYFS